MAPIKHLACIAGIAAVTASVSAGPVVFNLSQEFSGAAAPNGVAPWATATFTDMGSGTIRLTMDEKLQGAGEFLGKAAGGGGDRGWLFNLDPSLDAANLAFTWVSGTVAIVTTGSTNTYKPDGDGEFDIRIGWTDGLPKGAADVVYDLTISAGTLTTASFDFVSVNGSPGKDGFHSAVHVQGITNPSSGTGGSGWIADNPIIPLPTTAGMAFAGLLGLGCVRRRRDL